jgi:hypothetical protein
MVSSCRFPAALSEMLVQSTGSDLYLLPALPRDKWPQGFVKGLKARGGLTVNICWKEGSLHEALLWSGSSQNSLARVHYGSHSATISVSPGQVYRFNSDLKCLKSCPLWGCACIGSAIGKHNLLRQNYRILLNVVLIKLPCVVKFLLVLFFRDLSWAVQGALLCSERLSSSNFLLNKWPKMLYRVAVHVLFLVHCIFFLFLQETCSLY